MIALIKMRWHRFSHATLTFMRDVTSSVVATPTPNISTYGRNFVEKPCRFLSSVVRKDNLVSEYGGYRDLEWEESYYLFNIIVWSKDHSRGQFLANHVEVFRQAGFSVGKRVEGVLSMVSPHSTRANTTKR